MYVEHYLYSMSLTSLPPPPRSLPIALPPSLSLFPPSPSLSSPLCYSPLPSSFPPFPLLVEAIGPHCLFSDGTDLKQIMAKKEVLI